MSRKTKKERKKLLAGLLARIANKKRIILSVGILSFLAVFGVIAMEARFFLEDYAYWKGRYYHNGGEFDFAESEKWYRRSLVLESGTKDTHYRLSRLYFVNGELGKALSEIDEEEKIHPDYDKVHYQKGLIHGFQGVHLAAIDDFSKFIEMSPESWGGYNDLAWAYYNKGDFEKSKETAEKALEKFSGNPWLLNISGASEMKLGNREVGIEKLKLASENADKLTEDDWERAYSGNDPGMLADGLEGFRFDLENNLKLAQNDILFQNFKVVAACEGSIDAECSISAPDTVNPGQSFIANVTATNRSRLTDAEGVHYYRYSPHGVWMYPNNYLAIASGTSNIWGVSKIDLPQNSVIYNDQSYTFGINATAPGSSGTYKFDWIMYYSGHAFGERCAKNISVKSNTLPAPSVTISANPNPVDYNNPTNITWTPLNATFCFMQQDNGRDGTVDWEGEVSSANGPHATTTSKLTSDTDFRIQCRNNDNVYSNVAGVTVTVSSAVPTVTITALSPVAYNTPTNITWNPQNATFCWLKQDSGPENGLPDGVIDSEGPVSNSLGGTTSANLSSDTDFIIQCRNDAGVHSTPAVARVQVSPGPPQNLTGSCSGNSILTSWAGGGNTAYYAIRLDDYAVTPGETVAQPLASPHEFQNDNYLLTQYTHPSAASGHTYHFWVHGRSSTSGLYGPGVGIDVSCGAPPIPAPTVDVEANPGEVELNGKSMIYWTVGGNATSCRSWNGSSGWPNGSRDHSDGVYEWQTGNLNTPGTYTYCMQCCNDGGCPYDCDDVTVACTRDCTCEYSTCQGETCSDGCMGTCTGLLDCEHMDKWREIKPPE